MPFEGASRPPAARSQVRSLPTEGIEFRSSEDDSGTGALHSPLRASRTLVCKLSTPCALSRSWHNLARSGPTGAAAVLRARASSSKHANRMKGLCIILLSKRRSGLVVLNDGRGLSRRSFCQPREHSSSSTVGKHLKPTHPVQQRSRVESGGCRVVLIEQAGKSSTGPGRGARGERGRARTCVRESIRAVKYRSD